MNDTTASVTSSFDYASITGTLTSTAWSAITTAFDDWPDEAVNGTTPLSPLPTDGEISEGNYVINTLIGLVIVLVASVLNALGLNLTKLDHMQQQGIPKRQRKKEYMRWLWLAGMGIYIVSQLVGSPLALRYLRPDWVAPLGASALVFNFLFAYWLVGTPVSTSDIRGTALIVFGVILIVVFSSINHGLSQSLSIARLNHLWSRGSWLAYFSVLNTFIFTTYFIADLLAKLVKSRASFSPLPSPSLELPTSRPKPSSPAKRTMLRVMAMWTKSERTLLAYMERGFQRTEDARLAWLEGIMWAVTGGSLAGLCLVFTKAVVKIFWLPGHPLVHFSSLATLILVIITAVLQIVCLNRALKCADTVVVVPLFYAGYTVFGFVNALIFYDESGQYARWVLVAVFISISVLIAGVVLLSIKPSPSDPYTVTTEAAPSLRMRPRDHRAPDDAEAAASVLPKGIEEGGASASASGGANQDILWEVGSVSDDGSENEIGQKGVGGTKESHGERGGLLMAAEHDDEDEADVRRRPTMLRDEDDAGEDVDDFGDYEGVSPRVSQEEHMP